MVDLVTIPQFESNQLESGAQSGLYYELYERFMQVINVLKRKRERDEKQNFEQDYWFCTQTNNGLCWCCAHNTKLEGDLEYLENVKNIGGSVNLIVKQKVNKEV